MKSKHTNVLKRNKDIATVFAVTAGVLLIPLIAMQFNTDVKWDLLDFSIAGVLITATGLLIVWASRKITKTSHRIAVILTLLATLLLIWAHLAVGIIDTLPFAGS